MGKERMLHFLRAEGLRFRNRVIWSLDGWRSAWVSEKSLRQWVLANAVSAGLALILPVDPGARAAIIGLGIFVLAAELMNTAIEAVVDDISDKRRPLGRKAKDCASAAVALSALAVGAVWAVALWGLF